MSKETNVIEIFSSIQGEGKYVGCRQIFVRFSGCNLRCQYCDTIDSYNKAFYCKVENTAGNREFTEIENPLSVAEISSRINNLLKLPHHSVSFTGGEPLCQSDFLKEVAKKIKSVKYLETNGTLSKELASIIDDIDIISMDIKLPSFTKQILWREHEEFLKIANKKEVFVKVVVSAETNESEFKTAISLVERINKKITFIIQPITPLNGCCAISPEAVIQFQNLALRSLEDVRVIPQTHKFINQM